MKRVEGNSNMSLIECTNPMRGLWRIRWDKQPLENGEASYMEAEFPCKPTADEIQATIINWYNAQTDDNILSGFKFEGKTVWLSSENQFNYKAAYDLAVQTQGATLPVMFKFGAEDNTPIYHTFNTLEEFTAFYTQAMAHIQHTLANGWSKKDSFNMEDYMLD